MKVVRNTEADIAIGIIQTLHEKLNGTYDLQAQEPWTPEDLLLHYVYSLEELAFSIGIIPSKKIVVA